MLRPPQREFAYYPEARGRQECGAPSPCSLKKILIMLWKRISHNYAVDGMQWQGVSTCAQDSQGRGNIIGRDMAGLQLLMQVCQLVCGISACVGLPRSHIQDSPHLRNHPGLPGYVVMLSGPSVVSVMQHLCQRCQEGGTKYSTPK